MGERESNHFFVHNNVKLATLEEGQCRYAFVDSSEHCADRILMGSLIPTRFEVLEEQRMHDGFEVRVCSFKSRYESWFLCCMSDLEWILQVNGNYVGACERLLGLPVVIQSELHQLTDQARKNKIRDYLPAALPAL